MSSRETTRDEGRCPTCASALAAGAWCARCALGEILAEEVAVGKHGGLFELDGHAVLEEIGRGAAGIVYRARQEQPAREVALKILRPHEAASAESRARFRMEATTVAGLDHSAILPVLSVGEHDGLPYFTMKLCAGGSLAQHIGRYRGAWRDIATLMATLADAVQHAHERGVLHRDLKPGNILFDESGRAFVSDFGIAKSNRRANSGAPFTQPLSVMGTRGYVAPEVLRGGASGATLAADVYGLGAILHELITGVLPAENAGGAGATVTLKGVPRDLAVIAGKCLQPEPAGRYASAAALAGDLLAWLAGRPIAARPVSAVGQAWAWARRNPALAVTSAAALLALVAVAAVSSAAAVRLSREQRATAAALDRAEVERKRATTEAQVSKSIADFLQNDLLAQASPDQQPDRNLTLRAVLDRAAKKIENRFAAEPLIEASIQETLAKTYGGLGEYAPMQQHLERALALRQKKVGPDDPAVLDAKSDLVLALTELGKYPEAETLGQATLASQQRVLGREHADTLVSMINLETVYQHEGRPAEAQALLIEALEISKRVLGVEHPTTLQAMNDLAFVYRGKQAYAEAQALNLQTLELRRRVLGAEHPGTLSSLINVGSVYRAQGKFAEAEATFSELLLTSRRVLGAEHPTTLNAMNNLAVAYQDQRKFDEAAGLFAQILEISRRVVGAEHPNTLRSMNNLAAVDRGAGRLAEAESLYLETLRISRRTLGEEHLDTLRYQQNLGTIYLLEQKFSEAESIFATVLIVRQRLLGPEHAETLIALENLGVALSQQRRFADAEKHLRSLLEIRTRLSPGTWREAAASGEVGEVLAGERRFAEAEPLLLAAYEALKTDADKIPATSPIDFRKVAKVLARLYADEGNPTQAEAWRQKLPTPSDR